MSDESRMPASQLGQQIYVEKGGSAYVVMHGDMHIRKGHPVYRLEPYPLHGRSVNKQQAQRQPSRLLAAESRVVPFTARDDELAWLAAWRDDPAPGISVALVHGPGGQGKTRLAGQFALNSSGQGWTVWAAHHVSDPTAELVVAPGNPGSKLVLIVEYAERWPADDLQLLLLNPLLRGRERVRVLLVSRPAEGWWPALRHRLSKADIGVGGTLGLQSLAQTDVERLRVFVAACEAFAPVFGITADTVMVPANPMGEGFELILTLHMAALVVIDSCARDKVPPADQAGLSAYLLDREYDYWQSLHDHDHEIDTPPQVMARTVFVATLTRAQARHQAIEVLNRVGLTADTQAAILIKDHGRCYPPLNRGSVLEPLYPDRLGEDFLALLTPGHLVPDYTPDPWAIRAPAMLLPAEEESQAPPPWIRQTLAVLVEAAHRWPHLASNQLYPLLRRNPRLAISAGGVTLARIADIDGIDMQILEDIEKNFPEGRDFDLDIGIASVTEALIKRRPSGETTPVVEGKAYTGLADRLTNAGRHDDALVAITIAVNIYRQIAKESPESYSAGLASALSDLSNKLFEVGQRKPALEAISEAIGIYRSANATSAEELKADLANAMNRLGAWSFFVGRWQAGVEAAFESTRMYRELAENEPQRHLPALARSLNNLGIWLSNLHESGDEFLDYYREAISIRRRLYCERPREIAPYLAWSLTHYAGVLNRLGSAKEAMSFIAEAVEIYRKVVAANPSAYESDFAWSLTQHSAISAALGRRDEALRVAYEAVALRRRVAIYYPQKHAPDLAWTLTHLALRLTEMREGRVEAVEACDEAVEVLRKRSASDSLYDSDLATVLLTATSVRRVFGVEEQTALKDARTALAIYRNLASRNDKFTEDVERAESVIAELEG